MLSEAILWEKGVNNGAKKASHRTKFGVKVDVSGFAKLIDAFPYLNYHLGRWVCHTWMYSCHVYGGRKGTWISSCDVWSQNTELCYWIFTYRLGIFPRNVDWYQNVDQLSKKFGDLDYLFVIFLGSITPKFRYDISECRWFPDNIPTLTCFRNDVFRNSTLDFAMLL